MEQASPTFVAKNLPCEPEPLVWRLAVHFVCITDGMWLAAGLTHSPLRIMLPIGALGTALFGSIAWFFERSNG